MKEEYISKYDSSFNQRFWEKVNIAGENECWEWQASRNSKGYGCFSVDGIIKLAHRVSFELANGDIPEGLFVLHKCDNRLCVNPVHLFLGSHIDNMRDMIRKNRQAKGSKNGRSKLTISDIQIIRDIAKQKKSSSTVIGNRFKINPSYVRHIIRGDFWKE
jgi:hypothetical protein